MRISIVVMVDQTYALLKADICEQEAQQHLKILELYALLDTISKEPQALTLELLNVEMEN